MTTPTTPTTPPGHVRRQGVRPVKDPARWGAWSIALAVAAVGGLVFTWVLSVSDVMDPPNWARIPVILLLPFGVIGSLLAASGAWQGGDKARATIGLALTAAVVIGFVVLLNIAG